jgi:hypothetical protein
MLGPAIFSALVQGASIWRDGWRGLVNLVQFVGSAVLAAAFTLVGAWVISVCRSFRLLDSEQTAALEEQEARISELEDASKNVHPSRLVETVRNLLEQSPEARATLHQLMLRGELPYDEIQNTLGGRAVHRAGILNMHEYERPLKGPRPLPTFALSKLFEPVVKDVLYGHDSSSRNSQT